MFLFINSAYSFYWDVAKDWDLTLFSPARNDPDHPYGLRRHRYFSSSMTYYTAVAIDLLVRFSWVWPMSTHFEWLKHHEFGIFVMMFLEVARRWMWIFFRVEAEWGESFSPSHPLVTSEQFTMCFRNLIRAKSSDAHSTSTVRNNSGPAPDDILLGEFNRKFDSD